RWRTLPPPTSTATARSTSSPSAARRTTSASTGTSNSPTATMVGCLSHGRHGLPASVPTEACVWHAALAAVILVISRVRAAAGYPACQPATLSRVALLACHEPPGVSPTGAPGETRRRQPIAAAA